MAESPGSGFHSSSDKLMASRSTIAELKVLSDEIFNKILACPSITTSELAESSDVSYYSTVRALQKLKREGSIIEVAKEARPHDDQRTTAWMVNF